MCLKSVKVCTTNNLLKIENASSMLLIWMLTTKKERNKMFLIQ